jgi:hypothetical protein
MHPIHHPANSGAADSKILSRLHIQGEGTGRIEQLSSVAARLAEDLCLPFLTVYRTAINPAPADVANDCRLPMIPRALIIESIGETARKWTAALGQCTGAENLRNCTLLPFQGAIAPKRLVTLGRRWCPRCLEAMANNGPVYEPLVWRLSEVSICGFHRHALVDTCPVCQRGRQSSLVANARVGCCRYCGAWLGQKSADEGDGRCDDFSAYCAVACEEILALPQSEENAHAILPSDVSVSGLRDVFFAGNGSEMARRIGELPSQLNAYCNGDFPAPLHVFLRAGYVTGASMQQIFVSQDFGAPGVGKAQVSFEVRRAQHRGYSQSSVDGGLRSAIMNGGQLSVPQVASRLNVDISTMWRRSPELTRELAVAHANYVAKRSARAKIEFSDAVRSAVLQMRSEGLEPTASDVKRHLGDSGVGLNPWKRSVVREMTEDFGAIKQKPLEDDNHGDAHGER